MAWEMLGDGVAPGARTEINKIHNDLVFVAAEIGGICDMPTWASTGMAARVHDTGKRIYDVTIGELVMMIKAQEEYHALFERMAITNGVMFSTPGSGGDDQQG